MGHAEAWGLIPRAVEGFSLGKQHWDDPEGWGGEGDGRGFQDGEHMYTHVFMSMYRFMSMYGKTNTVL